MKENLFCSCHIDFITPNSIFCLQEGTFHSKTPFVCDKSPIIGDFRGKQTILFSHSQPVGLLYLTKWYIKLLSNFPGYLRPNHLNVKTCTFPLSLSCLKGEINTQLSSVLLSPDKLNISAKRQDVCDRVIFNDLQFLSVILTAIIDWPI